MIHVGKQDNDNNHMNSKKKEEPGDQNSNGKALSKNHIHPIEDLTPIEVPAIGTSDGVAVG